MLAQRTTLDQTTSSTFVDVLATSTCTATAARGAVTNITTRMVQEATDMAITTIPSATTYHDPLIVTTITTITIPTTTTITAPTLREAAEARPIPMGRTLNGTLLMSEPLKTVLSSASEPDRYCARLFHVHLRLQV